MAENVVSLAEYQPPTTANVVSSGEYQRRVLVATPVQFPPYYYEKTRKPKGPTGKKHDHTSYPAQQHYNVGEAEFQGLKVPIGDAAAKVETNQALSEPEQVAAVYNPHLFAAKSARDAIEGHSTQPWPHANAVSQEDYHHLITNCYGHRLGFVKRVDPHRGKECNLSSTSLAYESPQSPRGPNETRRRRVLSEPLMTYVFPNESNYRELYQSKIKTHHKDGHRALVNHLFGAEVYVSDEDEEVRLRRPKTSEIERSKTCMLSSHVAGPSRTNNWEHHGCVDQHSHGYDTETLLPSNKKVFPRQQRKPEAVVSKRCGIQPAWQMRNARKRSNSQPIVPVQGPYGTAFCTDGRPRGGIRTQMWHPEGSPKRYELPNSSATVRVVTPHYSTCDLLRWNH